VGFFISTPGTYGGEQNLSHYRRSVRENQLARNLAASHAGGRANLPTAQVLDPEMAAKIGKLRKDRGGRWDTYEEPLAVAELLRTHSDRGQYPSKYPTKC